MYPKWSARGDVGTNTMNVLVTFSNSIRPINLPPISISYELVVVFLFRYKFTSELLHFDWMMLLLWGILCTFEHLNTRTERNDWVKQANKWTASVRICMDLVCVCVCFCKFAFVSSEHSCTQYEINFIPPGHIVCRPLHSMSLNWMCVFENRFRIRHGKDIKIFIYFERCSLCFISFHCFSLFSHS